LKIYTKTGDTGETSLFDNSRVSKADPRVDAYGEVDEVNACVGAAIAALGDGPASAFAHRAMADKEAGRHNPAEAGLHDIEAVLQTIQKDLFAVGARLADPSSRIADRVTKAAITTEQIELLEATIDRLEEELPPLRRFILPGGSTAGALLHLARTVCRRAERRVIGLGPDAVESGVIIYLNRLSDLLFVMARAVNHRAGIPEMEW
jgi:cob(I)alamin adenosyltransferase